MKIYRNESRDQQGRSDGESKTNQFQFLNVQHNPYIVYSGRVTCLH